jgi:signal transduction histidine kinase
MPYPSNLYIQAEEPAWQETFLDMLVPDLPLRLTEKDLATIQVYIFYAPANRCIMCHIIHNNQEILIPLALLNAAILPELLQLNRYSRVNPSADMDMVSSLIKKMGGFLIHDIKNPLNNILLATSQLRMENLSLEEENTFCLEIIERNCARINSLLSDTFDLWNITAPHFSEFNLYNVLEEVLQRCRNQFDTMNITCYHTGEKQVILSGDKNHIDRALHCIFQNAIEAMAAEGGQLDIQLTQEMDWISILVRDTGPGIKTKNQTHAFIPFYSTKPHHKGIGLTYVKQVMDMHGGNISISSPAGKGALIQLKIPRERQGDLFSLHGS